VLGLYPFALETQQGWSFEVVRMSFISLRAFAGGYTDFKDMNGTNNITWNYIFSPV
jgi:hypothetical protein